MNAVCAQINELLAYRPSGHILQQERLKDISHAFGLLFHHFRQKFQMSAEPEVGDS